MRTGLRAVGDVVPLLITCIENLSGVAVADGFWLLSTILMTVRVAVVGAAAVLVNVQVTFSPAPRVRLSVWLGATGARSAGPLRRSSQRQSASPSMAAP